MCLPMDRLHWQIAFVSLCLWSHLILTSEKFKGRILASLRLYSAWAENFWNVFGFVFICIWLNTDMNFLKKMGWHFRHQPSLYFYRFVPAQTHGGSLKSLWAFWELTNKMNTVVSDSFISANSTDSASRSNEAPVPRCLSQLHCED